jgi:SAM-dependent methyltransferase
MKNILISLIRRLKPKSRYKLAPISSRYGFDRGHPIDRFYIEKFLENNKKYVSGTCLEIHDNKYTKFFGQERVLKSDVLDIDPHNDQANIHADLRNLSDVKNNYYDCIILTQTLGMIDDYEAVIRECHRILKNRGVLLLTVSALGPIYEISQSYWRFTTMSMKYVLNKFFDQRNVHVQSFGNVLAGQCFWVGLAQEDLAQHELEYNDPHFPVIVAACAKK